MTLVGGQLKLDSEGTIALTAAGGFTPLGPAVVGLTTSLSSSGVEFSTPQTGRIQYDGQATRTFDVRSIVSVDLDGVGDPVQVKARLAKNGVSIPESEAEITLSTLMGTADMVSQASVELAQGDTLEVVLEVSADRTVAVRALSLMALIFVAATSSPTGVDDAALRALVGPCLPPTLEVTPDLGAARALMAQHLDASGADADLLYQIELRLAAHFVALRVPECRLASEREEGLAASYAGKLGDGLRATFFGQSALGLDPTGTLESLDGPAATLRVY